MLFCDNDITVMKHAGDVNNIDINTDTNAMKKVFMFFAHKMLFLTIDVVSLILTKMLF